jgi:hypothetical protein
VRIQDEGEQAKELTMKKTIPLAIAMFAVTLPQLASAVPLRATFDGSVAGSDGFFSNVLNDFPVGTAASFDVTFDDTALVDDASLVTSLDLAPVSGWVRLGGLEWTLDAGRIYTYTYNNTPPTFPILSFGAQLTGTGPTIAAGAASLFGLFLSLAPDGQAGPYAQSIGFRYPFDGGEFYSYADLSGEFHTSRENRSVPEPNTVLLMSSALGLLLVLRVRKRVKAD